MKALLSLKSAKNQSSVLAIVALTAIAPMVFPLMTAAAQTSGQPAVVFQINSLPNQNISFNQITASDPLVTDLQQFFIDNNSPLKDYVPQLVSKPNWKQMVAISFVESNFCVHNLHNNCSGIGGPGNFEKYQDFSGWIDRMSDLLATRYDGWSFKKMDGVYVQPYSYNWRLGAENTYNKLTDIENQAANERAAMAQTATAQPIADLAMVTK